MQVLAIVVAIFSLVALAASVAGGGALPLYVPLSGLALAAVVHFAQRVSAFVQVFVAMYDPKVQILGRPDLERLVSDA